MKKKFIFFTALLLATVMCASAFIACTPRADRQTTAAYTVRFNDNYEGDYAKAEVEAGKTAALPAEPTRTGYKFVGWYLSDDPATAEKFDETKPVGNNITLYAKWERDNTLSLVTLKFRNYVTADAVYAVKSGTAFARPATPVYNGDETYGFVDWFADKACTHVYDFAAAVNEDTTLYAGWIQRKAYVKFDYNYTACPEPAKVLVELGKTVSLINTPTREQYEFGGWYTSRINGEPFDAAAPIDADLTVYAHWVRSEYMVTFNANGATLADNVETSYVVKRDTSAADVADTVRKGMTYPGHDFAGWYLVKTDPDAEEPITAPQADLSKVTDDVVFYAGWTLHEYEIKFDYNYQDAPAAPDAQKVKYGKLVSDPGTPTRNGYIFGGWFLTASGSDQFTLDTPVSADMKLYAKWIDESSAHENVTVTYYYDAGAGSVRHAVKTIKFNGTADSDSPAEPVAKDYIFAGWYEDAAFTKAFNMKKNLTENVSVYGKMLKKYTFEAEAIDFTGKRGQGTSTNSVEEGMIMDSSFVEGGDVSNGYFVRELYYNGASLDFNIQADAEVDDAVLYLRVSSESYEFATVKEVGGVKYNYLSETDFKIVVNGKWDGDTPLTWLNYGGLYMPMANVMDREDLAQHKTPFEDRLIIRGLHLQKGRNVISLYVDNNNNHGGTFHAEAPIIDCMYIYSSANLSMEDHKFYERPNVNRG